MPKASAAATARTESVRRFIAARLERLALARRLRGLLEGLHRGCSELSGPGPLGETARDPSRAPAKPDPPPS
jgi:hypothetical protein